MGLFSGVKKFVKNVEKEVSKGVKNVTKEVSKGVNNVVKETSKGIELTGVVIANSGNLIGGDVGKVVNAVAAPFGGQIAATGSLVKGDIKGAATRAVGSQAQASFGAATVSSTVERSLTGNTLKSVTFDMTEDWVNASNSSKNMINTGEATSEDWKNITQSYVKTGVAAAVVGGASYLGGTEYAKALGASAISGAKGVVSGVATGAAGKAIKDAIAGKKDEATVSEGSANQSAQGSSALLVLGAGALFILSLIF